MFFTYECDPFLERLLGIAVSLTLLFYVLPCCRHDLRIDCLRKRCLYQWDTDPQSVSFPPEYEISSSLVCHARLHPSVPRVVHLPLLSLTPSFSLQLNTHVSRTCVGSGADKDLFSISLFPFRYFRLFSSFFWFTIICENCAALKI